jgi:hypothetical protein
MSINFIKVLANAKQTILTEITKKSIEAASEIIKTNPTYKKRLAIKDKIEKLKEQIKQLESERDNIGTRINTEDAFTQKIQNISGVSEAWRLVTGSYYISSMPQEIVNAIAAQADRKEFTNPTAFKDICGRFDRMMSMATGSKEQRAILLQFYRLDWKGLGIDVPADMDISNIDIKDGRIIADTRLLAAPKKSKK